MTKAQKAITTMVLLAGIANAYGSIRKSKDIVYPVVGGFIVLILLLALAQVEVRVAEAFAGAYTITSILVNGDDLINGLTTALNSGQRFDPGPGGHNQPTSFSGTATSTSTTSTSTATPTSTVNATPAQAGSKIYAV